MEPIKKSREYTDTLEFSMSSVTMDRYFSLINILKTAYTNAK